MSAQRQPATPTPETVLKQSTIDFVRSYRASLGTHGVCDFVTDRMAAAPPLGSGMSQTWGRQ